MKIIQIKCPWCSAVLSVKYQEGLETASVTCPVCKRKSPYSQFKPYSAPLEESTCYPAGIGRDVNTSSPAPIGRLFIPSIGSTYYLSEGLNIVGRSASASQATIGLNVGSNKRISREHIVINVTNIPGRGLVHSISLYKERVNQTSVNGEILTFGDNIILKHGDIINLPDLDVRFEIPDPDQTEI